MDKVLKKNKCTGCTSCANICPKKAIMMKKGKDGFKYPVIDQNKCINCGLCRKTCPVINTKSNTSLNECYVGYNTDCIEKKETSSGGIFPLLAKYIISCNGLVVGAAFDENNELRHIAVASNNDLIKLKGSKYLQSDLSNIYTYIKENLKEKKVLFVGTPCQVAGLKAFLKIEYDNLYCVDLICHGVPTPKLFQKYVKELEKKYNDKLVKYIFRDKSTGWDTYSNTMCFEKQKISELQNNNDYMKLFLSDFALRESCYKCNFKLGNKYSDMTLGDFWGVDKCYPDMYDKNGVSAIIINTTKGLELFNIIKTNMKYKKSTLDSIISGNSSLVKSGTYPRRRKKFFYDIEVLSINDLAKKYKKKKRIIRVFLGRIKRIIKRIV